MRHTASNNTQQEFNFSFDMPPIEELEDYTKTFSGLTTELPPQQEEWLSQHLRSLTPHQLLDRYRQLMKRNTGSPNKLAGYRKIRAEAYRRKLFDEIDIIDKALRCHQQQKEIPC